MCASHARSVARSWDIFASARRFVQVGTHSSHPHPPPYPVSHVAERPESSFYDFHTAINNDTVRGVCWAAACHLALVWLLPRPLYNPPRRPQTIGPKNTLEVNETAQEIVYEREREQSTEVLDVPPFPVHRPVVRGERRLVSC